MEFTPYWTKNHGLSLDEYLYPKNYLDQLTRNSSFSVASTQNFILGDSTASNGLALGYRTTFYLGNKADREKIQSFNEESVSKKRMANRIGIKAEELIDDSKIQYKADFLGEIKSTILDALRMYLSEEESVRLTNKILLDADTLPEMDSIKLDDFVDTFTKVVDENLKGEDLFNKFKGYIKEREGISVDVAYAALLNFPTNNFEYSSIPRQSFWVTPTFRFKDKLNFLKAMMVLRYDWYDLEYYKKYFPNSKIYENNRDIGFAISTEFSKFSLQFEVVSRYSNSDIPAGTDTEGHPLFRKDHKSDFQYIGTFSYNLTDQIVASYNIGNRFDPIQNPNNTLISNLSVNFGFGAPTKNCIK